MCCIFQDLFYSQLPEKSARFIQPFFLPTLLIIHSSCSGKASLALGKRTTEYDINAARFQSPLSKKSTQGYRLATPRINVVLIFNHGFQNIPNLTLMKS